jgi:hypothetical protein
VILDTTPPKERIKDTSKDFYSAGFAPGAIVYFSYDLPKGKNYLHFNNYLKLGEKWSIFAFRSNFLIA